MPKGILTHSTFSRRRSILRRRRSTPLRWNTLLILIISLSIISCSQGGGRDHTISSQGPLTTAPHLASPSEPNAPNITLINPGLSANNSYISTSSGIFVFQISVLPNETTASLPASMKNLNPQIQIDGGSYENFTNEGGENWDWFSYSWPVGAHGVTHWVKINATNNNSFTTILFLNLTIDLNPPNFVSSSPAHETNVSTDCVVSVNVTDDLSGISYIQLILHRLFPSSWSSGPQFPIYNGTTHLWEWIWPVVSGSWVPSYYNLSFTIADIAGNSILHNISVLVDYQAPNLLFLSHSNETAISGIVSFEVFARDYGTGVENVTIQVGSSNETLMSPAAAFTYRYTLDTRPLPDGALPLVVRSRDYTGIINQTLWELSVDNSIPTITVSGKTTLAGLANFTINCADGQGLGHILWRLDSNVYNALPLLASQYLLFTTQNYVDGPHTLEVRVEDQASPANTRVIIQQVFIDNSVPQVSAQNLWDGCIVDLDFVLKVRIFETVGQENSITLQYQLNNETWVVVPHETGTNLWRVPFSSFALKGGQNEIILRGIDGGGNYDDDTYYFIYIKPPAFDLWLIIILVAIAAIGLGIFLVIRKFHHASRDYQQRVSEEVQRARDQEKIQKTVEEELSKVQISPGGFLKKPEKSNQKPTPPQQKQEK